MITTHTLAKLLLECQDLPVAYFDGEQGECLLHGDLETKEQPGLFMGDWEEDNDSPRAVEYYKQYPNLKNRADGYGRLLRLKKDAPKREVVVLT